MTAKLARAFPIAAIVAAGDAGATRAHPARVYRVEAPWDIGPMAGDPVLIYETPVVE